MNTQYEIVEYPDALPIRTYAYSVRSFPMHWHQEMEILLVLKGSIHVMLQNTNVTIKAGELVVISPNVLHATQQSDEPNQVLLLQIQCGKFAFHDSQIDTMEFDCVGGEQDHPQMAKLRSSVCSVLLEMAYKHAGYRYAASAHVQTILSTLLRYFPHRQSATLQAMKGKERERMLRLMDFINANYRGRITLRDLAEQEYLSVNHLSTLIHKALGIGFAEYLSSVRLKAYVEGLQSEPLTPLGEIAEQCGFSSPQFASSLFYKTYQTTPGRYRRQLEQINATKVSARKQAEDANYVSVYRPADLKEVLYYVQERPAQALGSTHATLAGLDVEVEVQGTVGAYHRSAVRIASIGRAYEGLLSHVQDRLRTARHEIGFTHLRFHGMFHDDMMILRAEESGSIQYSWRLVDQLFDFLVSIGLHPFVELTYMPTLLASGQDTVFAWRGNITPPKRMGVWCDLVRALVDHCLRRYGEEEVAQWYFEVWNEPDFRGVSWSGSEQEFFQFYTETAFAIRQACSCARVCGPSLTRIGLGQKKWMPAFVEYCVRAGVPLDAFTLHAYPENLCEKDLRKQLIDMAGRCYQDKPTLDVRGQDYVEEMLDGVRQQLEGIVCVPLIVSEWNITMAVCNPINDSAFAATSLLQSALHCDAGDVLLIHWTLCDYMEEQPVLPLPEFHGGFGLMTVGGIRKATYWAMWALSRLGPQVVWRMENGVVTRYGRGYRLLAFQHPITKGAYDTAYAFEHDAEALRGFDVYRFAWKLRGLSGRYRARRSLYDAAECDAKTLAREWGLSGESGGYTQEDMLRLTHMAQPRLTVQTLEAVPEEGLTVMFHLRQCAFELIELEPLG